MDMTGVLWDGQQEGCEVCQCSRLISDKFRINSAGKTPQARREESAARAFSSRMPPGVLSFERDGPLRSIENRSLSARRPAKAALCAGEDKENTECSNLDEHSWLSLYRCGGEPCEGSPLKRKATAVRRYSGLLGGESLGRTPSKFSMVRNSLVDPAGCTPSSHSSTLGKPRDSPHTLDNGSRDSGFENSSGFEGTSCARTPTFPKIHEEMMNEACHYSAFQPFESFDKRNDFETYDSDRRKKVSDMEDYEFDTLHDLEEEFDSEIASESKYEIISTDSPDINAARAGGHVGKIFAKNFEFGSPMGDFETSENFGAVSQPQKISRRMPVRSETTRMLNFDLDSPAPGFQFTPPALQSQPSPSLTQHKPDVKIDIFKASPPFDGSVSSPLCSQSSRKKAFKKMSASTIPGSRRSRLFDSISTGSVESCVSEIEDCMLFDMDTNNDEDDDSRNIPDSIGALISWEIKEEADKKEPALNWEEEKKIESPVVIRRPAFRRCVSLSQEGRGPKRGESAPGMGGASKRRRQEGPRPVLHRALSDNEASIKTALARSYTEPDLIGDFSKPFVLPLEESEHEDLKSISGDTLAKLMAGQYRDQVDHYEIIDCRYPYEFEGGHIAGALNLHSEELIRRHLLAVAAAGDAIRTVLVFHCEFSTQRGPNLCRYLRSTDRALHRDDYPRLRHPELYVLRGGYRRFHARHGALCRGGYTPMLAPQHTQQMRAMRAAAGRRPVL